MLRAMTVDVTVTTVEPTPTAVVAAAATWAEFPKLWGPMLDQVWSFLRGDAPAGLYQHGHNIMLYQDDVPNVEVGVQVSRSFDPAGQVVASTLPGGLVGTGSGTSFAAPHVTGAWAILKQRNRAASVAAMHAPSLPRPKTEAD